MSFLESCPSMVPEVQVLSLYVCPVFKFSQSSFASDVRAAAQYDRSLVQTIGGYFFPSQHLKPGVTCLYSSPRDSLSISTTNIGMFLGRWCGFGDNKLCSGSNGGWQAHNCDKCRGRSNHTFCRRLHQGWRQACGTGTISLCQLYSAACIYKVSFDWYCTISGRCGKQPTVWRVSFTI